jgi:uncharacterized membrane protein YraQ (UPF0718 family)
MEFIKSEWKKLFIVIMVFLGLFFLPLGSARFDNSIMQGLGLLKDYARNKLLFGLVPAFFLAGGVATFLNKGAVIKYLGTKAKKTVAYAVASTSGIILACCSCSVLPLFAGIYKRGAGIGPATTFLYSGPAINILAIVLTANVLGLRIGIARVTGSLLFSVTIGLIMAFIFRKENREGITFANTETEQNEKTDINRNIMFFAPLVGLMIFIKWASPQETSGAIWRIIYTYKWIIVSICIIAFFITLASRFRKNDISEWLVAAWGFAKMILPLLLYGVFISGFLFGIPGGEGLIPSEWVSKIVGGNSLKSNFLASFVGSIMYFSTLTEIPIIQGLMGNGMGNGPALALLLSGPALSLPNMLIIRKILGTKKTTVYVGLVVIMATISGLIFGSYF